VLLDKKWQYNPNPNPNPNFNPNSNPYLNPPLASTRFARITPFLTHWHNSNTHSLPCRVCFAVQILYVQCLPCRALPDL